MEIIIGRQGTQKTPITDPTVSRKHCKVTVIGDGTYIIENLSPAGTKVEGVNILRTTAKADSRIQLGQTYTARLSEIIGLPEVTTKSQSDYISGNAAESNIMEKSQSNVKTFNISHLRRIWEDYNSTNIDMADSQRKTNLARTGLGIFTMCAMPTIFFFGPVGYVLTCIGILGNIYSFVGMKNAETAAERQRRQDAFDDAWVCPNPDCGHSIIAKNYKMLVKNFKSCPYCKCNYVEI